MHKTLTPSSDLKSSGERHWYLVRGDIRCRSHTNLIVHWALWYFVVPIASPRLCSGLRLGPCVSAMSHACTQAPILCS